MQEQDLAAIKEALSQLRSDRHPRHTPLPRRWAGSRPATAGGHDANRSWIDAPSATATRAAAPVVVPPPIPPGTVTLAEPFGLDLETDQPTGVLLDFHFEPGDNWAKLYLKVSEDFGYYFFTFDFLWENTTGADATVNVATSVNVTADAEATSEPYWVPNAPGIPNATAVGVRADLILLQWVNQAWTAPPYQTGQAQQAVYVTADGGWRLNPFNSIDVEFQSVDAAYNLRYNDFTVRRDGVAVFEVGLLSQVLLYHDGEGFVEAGHGRNVVGCPGVHLTLSPPLTNV